MRIIYGAAFTLLSLMVLAAMFPPAGNVYGAKIRDPGTLPSVAKIEQAFLPAAPQPVSVTVHGPQG